MARIGRSVSAAATQVTIVPQTGTFDACGDPAPNARSGAGVQGLHVTQNNVRDHLQLCEWRDTPKSQGSGDKAVELQGPLYVGRESLVAVGVVPFDLAPLSAARQAVRDIENPHLPAQSIDR